MDVRIEGWVKLWVEMRMGGWLVPRRQVCGCVCFPLSPIQILVSNTPPGSTWYESGWPNEAFPLNCSRESEQCRRCPLGPGGGSQCPSPPSRRGFLVSPGGLPQVYLDLQSGSPTETSFSECLRRGGADFDHPAVLTPPSNPR